MARSKSDVYRWQKDREQEMNTYRPCTRGEELIDRKNKNHWNYHSSIETSLCTRLSKPTKVNTTKNVTQFPGFPAKIISVGERKIGVLMRNQRLIFCGSIQNGKELSQLMNFIQQKMRLFIVSEVFNYLLILLYLIFLHVFFKVRWSSLFNNLSMDRIIVLFKLTKTMKFQLIG